MRQGHIGICILTYKQIITTLNIVATSSNQSNRWSSERQSCVHLPAEPEDVSPLSPNNLSLRMQRASPGRPVISRGGILSQRKECIGMHRGAEADGMSGISHPCWYLRVKTLACRHYIQ